MEDVTEASKWLPALSLNASKSFEKDDTEFNTLLKNVNVIFTLDVSTFKKGANVFDISRAKIDAKQSTYDYYEAVKNIEQAVVNAWNNVLIAKAIIKASQEAAATLALEGVE